MAKKESLKLWHPYGRKVLLKAVRKGTNGIIIASSVAKNARELYDYFIHEKGGLVPEDLKTGNEVFLSLPGIETIEGVTDNDAEVTYFMVDYNFIKGQR